MSQVVKGMRFGRWVVVRDGAPTYTYHLQRRQKRARVLVRCVCGRERLIQVRDLKRGRSHGCTSGRCREAYAVELARLAGVEAAVVVVEESDAAPKRTLRAIADRIRAMSAEHQNLNGSR